MLKFMRSLVCLTLCVAMTVSLCVRADISATAEESAIQPRWSYTNSTATGLTITTAQKAACTATVQGYSSIATKVHIDMQLQQYLALQWTTIGAWEGTFNNYYGSLSKSKALTSSGNYRVKAVYTVYSGSASEKITMYSQEKYFTKP